MGTSVGEPEVVEPRFKRGALILTFPADSEYAGLKIRAKRFNIDQLSILATVRSLDSRDPAVMEQVKDQICPVLAGSILRWNYDDDDDQPVEPDEAGIRGLDIEMLYAIVRAITGGQIGASPPLPQPSDAGEDRELEDSMPMEFPSPSPESLSEPSGS